MRAVLKKEGKKFLKSVPLSRSRSKVNELYSGPGHILLPSLVEIRSAVFVQSCLQTNKPTGKTKGQEWKHNLLNWIIANQSPLSVLQHVQPCISNMSCKRSNITDCSSGYEDYFKASSACESDTSIVFDRCWSARFLFPAEHLSVSVNDRVKSHSDSGASDRDRSHQSCQSSSQKLITENSAICRLGFRETRTFFSIFWRCMTKQHCELRSAASSVSAESLLWQYKVC